MLYLPVNAFLVRSSQPGLIDINGVVGGNYDAEESVSPYTHKSKKVRKTYTLEIVTNKKLRVARNGYDGFIEFDDYYSSCTFQGEMYKRD